jgi:hypothetical protein
MLMQKIPETVEVRKTDSFYVPQYVMIDVMACN